MTEGFSLKTYHAPKPEKGWAKDLQANYNMRCWVEDALTAKGAKITGAGCGGCSSDLDFELEGMTYNIQIKPK